MNNVNLLELSNAQYTRYGEFLPLPTIPLITNDSQFLDFYNQMKIHNVPHEHLHKIIGGYVKKRSDYCDCPMKRNIDGNYVKNCGCEWY